MTEQNTGGQPSDADYWYALGVKDGRDGCLVELGALQARCDKLEAAVRQMVDAISKGAVDSEEIVPVPGDGPPYRFHEEWAHHARSALLPKENEDDE